MSGREGKAPSLLNFGPEVNYRVSFSVQCSDNSRAVASVWQMAGGGGGGGGANALPKF